MIVQVRARHNPRRLLAGSEVFRELLTTSTRDPTIAPVGFRLSHMRGVLSIMRIIVLTAIGLWVLWGMLRSSEVEAPEEQHEAPGKAF